MREKRDEREEKEAREGEKDLKGDLKGDSALFLLLS